MSDRVLKKVQEASDDQTAYEAQQQLKSIYHRLRSRQKLEEAYELLSKGCISHIANGQVHATPAGYFQPSYLWHSSQIATVTALCR